MKRASVTFTDELETRLERYLDAQHPPPSLSSLVNAALKEYLDRRAWLDRGHRPAPDPGPLDLPVSDAEVESDVSENHDAYL